jgi:hypothetical protein
VLPHKQTLEETLQAFIQSQSQINQDTRQDIQELKNAVGRIESQLNVREKGKFPAQPEPNPRTRAGVNEVNNTQMEHAKSVTILRSGKVVNKEVPIKVSQPKGDLETKEDDKPSEVEDVVEKVYKPVAPFLQRLLAPKKGIENQDILEVFKQVKINIPLLDAIKQIPSYAKFLKDLCTVKRKLLFFFFFFFFFFFSQKGIFNRVGKCYISAKKLILKQKDPGSPTIPCIIGYSKIDKALMDLGAGVNLLPYTVYEQLGLGELKPTKVVLQLADRSIVIPRGVVDDVLVQVDKFYFPVDFIVLDTKPISHSSIDVPVILGRPFLATSNALINCRNGIMKLTFGNMTVELNIFNNCKQPGIDDDAEILEEDMIQTLVEDTFSHSRFSDPI